MYYPIGKSTIRRSPKKTGIRADPATTSQTSSTAKVGSERSREFSFGYFSFGGQKKSDA
ncbi:hypothetical protein HDF19_07860 [Mucilaginibacter sp. E4BP6]|uniref:hypothetical protein n=1 Tax=Mucilaginibacter sp. E4BP6 TaxID=2723089 RepID=UPI0015CBE001|nr:hypothetical protein [Mucilaginibacter sp. E4BP6]NYE67524.1 hypothetical protein [Mucilaginibacter sp. E4BP6]